MHKHYIKPIFSELWDKHQIKVSREGGNRNFLQHLKKFGIKKASLSDKYRHKGIKRYRKQLINQIEGRAWNFPSDDEHEVTLFVSGVSEKTKQKGRKGTFKKFKKLFKRQNTYN